VSDDPVSQLLKTGRLTSDRTEAAQKVEQNKPQVLLPGMGQTISDAGSQLGKLLAGTKQFYNRNGTVTKVRENTSGAHALEAVSYSTLTSDFETVAALVRENNSGTQSAICSEQHARTIASSDSFLRELPEITVVTDCPVLIERDGQLVEIVGYDLQSGILAGGHLAKESTLEEAKTLLFELARDFRFNQPSDKARALAAMVTPALVFGGLLSGRAPIDLGEADKSQTGKGYRLKVTAAIYGQPVKTVTQRKGGVGSLEESLQSAIIRGNNFICIDNVRGKIDSPLLESILTEETVEARGLRISQEIDVTRTMFQVTSNKAELTKDLSNRSSCVKILKQPDGHHFRIYHEGDLLEHIRANPGRYLGAVFTIIRAWYKAGKPRTRETRHDFRAWAQSLDWITLNLLGAGPLLDGHKETQERMTNPALNWLRDVALEVTRLNHNERWLRAGEIVEIISETEIETPGLSEGQDIADEASRKCVLQAVGRKLRQCFNASEVVMLDDIEVTRQIIKDQTTSRDIKEYRFSEGPIARPLGGNPQVRQSIPFEFKMPPVGLPNPPPVNSPMKALCSPNPPENSRIDSISPNEPSISEVMSSPGGSGGDASLDKSVSIDESEIEWIESLS
jgi:hypothetical protein